MRGSSEVRAFVLAAVTVLLPLALVHPSPAHASYGPCSGTNKSRFAGAKNNAGANTYGVRADIEYRAASLCGNDGIFSTTWSMIQNADTISGGQGWVQTGYGNFGSFYSGHYGQWIWGQYNAGCNSAGTSCQAHDVWGPAADSSTHTYVARYYASDGLGHMLYDGHEIGQTPWSMTYQWGTDWQGQFYGETKYVGSDVSGIPADHTSFTNVQRLTYPSGSGATWSDIANLTKGTDSEACRYNAEWITSGQSFRIWTDPMTSNNC